MWPRASGLVSGDPAGSYASKRLPSGLMTVVDKPGTIVMSLDFELHWGMRDRAPATREVAENLFASRAMVEKIANLFIQRKMRATWATVGMLFASSGNEVERFRPSLRPAYLRPELDPYAEPIGVTEEEDPLHLAGSLVDWLSRAPGQEVASHTFSHYYCLEHGQDAAMFRADLDAAHALAESRNIRLKSLVLPRNQWRTDLADVVLDSGFECYRGPQPGWATRSRRDGEGGSLVRAARLAETYAGRPLCTFDWQCIMEPSGLCNVPASAFLRPFSPSTRVLEPLRWARLLAGLRDAARRGRIMHVWWHPHNFVAHPDANLAFLSRLFDEVDRLRRSDGLCSSTMGDVNDAVRGRSADDLV
jgi:peptidoglycan/xylan/chitin deacetylase (PgdA/CDA1 family)